MTGHAPHIGDWAAARLVQWAGARGVLTPADFAARVRALGYADSEAEALRIGRDCIEDVAAVAAVAGRAGVTVEKCVLVTSAADAVVVDAPTPEGLAPLAGACASALFLLGVAGVATSYWP